MPRFFSRKKKEQTQQLNASERLDGLGCFSVLPNDVILYLFGFFNPFELCSLSVLSKIIAQLAKENRLWAQFLTPTFSNQNGLTNKEIFRDQTETILPFYQAHSYYFKIESIKCTLEKVAEKECAILKAFKGYRQIHNEDPILMQSVDRLLSKAILKKKPGLFKIETIKAAPSSLTDMKFVADAMNLLFERFLNKEYVNVNALEFYCQLNKFCQTNRSLLTLDFLIKLFRYVLYVTKDNAHPVFAILMRGLEFHPETLVKNIDQVLAGVQYDMAISLDEFNVNDSKIFSRKC